MERDHTILYFKHDRRRIQFKRYGSEEPVFYCLAQFHRCSNSSLRSSVDTDLEGIALYAQVPP